MHFSGSWVKIIGQSNHGGNSPPGLIGCQSAGSFWMGWHGSNSWAGLAITCEWKARLLGDFVGWSMVGHLAFLGQTWLTS